MGKIERKVVPFHAVSTKSDDDVVRFAGYASTFGNKDLVGDIVMPGAFAKSLGVREAKMFWNHNSQMIPIGKWTNMREDEKGLFVEGELTKGHSVAGDVAAAMRHGTIDRMSIGYRTVQSKDNDDGVRELLEVDLMEVSPVNFPANEAAEIVNVKSLIEGVHDIKGMERLLRDVAGVSCSEAKALVSRFKDIVREADSKSEIQPEDVTNNLVDLINRYSLLEQENG